ncbi:U-box domain-containing protein 30 [Glycine soja]|uniref:U-box domain-containing protein n=1 Tax=Glycine soja TaxID=3848 RepID=A0A445M5E0_GLYSO|nr:U-box domain-containing protein 30 [Glycine soja]RZC30814.1 U-box domain-containing protein 30 [Glycine soja]
MPMFQPCRKDMVTGYEGGGDGQILDLDTAVKDGVLGGVEGGVVGGGVGEKVDLGKMIEELELCEVPSVFICPISLEPMQDPITLCTGQTYERSNILKWFNLGHFTCPTTMQELWDDSVTPNTTLYRLIHTWFSQKYLLMKKRSEDVQGRASELLETLKKVKGQARVQALKEIHQLVASHATARKAVIDEGGVSVVSSLLGPFTSHAVGSEVIGILVTLTLDSESRKNLLQPAKVSLMVDILNEGSIETKINCTRLIESLIEEKDFRSEVISSHSLLVGLMRLVKDKRHSNGLVELLSGMEPDCTELALCVLDALASVPEGRVALKDCSNTIPIMVKLLMRISENCTQYALSILWSVCKLSPDECSSIAVDAGLAAKLLLVIQSGCNPILKQQSAELLKLCSLNYSDTIFISKCKLTRTIQ